MKDKKKIQVVAALIFKDNKFLIAKRAKVMSSGGLWEFPGGKVEVDEDPKQALKREIIEELNCEICIGNFVGESQVEVENTIIQMSLFAAEIEKGEPVIVEHEEIRWIGIEQLYDFSWAPADIPLLDKVYRYYDN
jgi:8-oxo-dGTP diphosphatase